MPEHLLMPGVLVRKHHVDMRPGGEAAAAEKDGDGGEQVGDAHVLAVAPGDAGAHEDGPGGEAAAREKQDAQSEHGAAHEERLRNAAALEMNHIRQN